MLLGKTANKYGIINVIEITGTFCACLIHLFKPYLYLYASKLIQTSDVASILFNRMDLFS